MRVLLILALAIPMISACQHIDESVIDVENPLSECVIAGDPSPSGEVFIQWNGFEEGVVILLKGESGAETSAEIVVITGSGLIFRIPAGLSPGMYTVIADQDGRHELGQIQVTEKELPVTGLKMPDSSFPGGSLVITGSGFDSSFSVFLMNHEGRTDLVSTLAPAGLKVEIPVNVPDGSYDVYLTDGYSEWLVAESFTIASRKWLMSVSMTGPYSGAMKYRTSYSLEYQDGEVSAIVYTASVIENGAVVEEEIRDRYARGDDGVFRVDGGTSSSNNFNFGYVRDNEGRILTSDVLRYSRNNPAGAMREFTWVYDEEDRPSKVTFELNGSVYSLQVYLYEDGNLVDTSVNGFVYEDESLVYNKFAADAAHGYDMMTNTMEPFLYAPYLCGEHPFSSRLLPSALKQVTGPTSIKKVPVTYEFDSDRYPVMMSWDSGNTYIEFEYVETL